MPSNSNIALTRKQQHNIIDQVSHIFKIPPYLLKILFKFAFRDKTFEPQFFQDVAEIISNCSGGSSVHPGFV